MNCGAGGKAGTMAGGFAARKPTDALSCDNEPSGNEK
jgi:hypothetical protein